MPVMTTPKGWPDDHEAEQHADGRQHHRGEHKADRDEAIELRQKDREDQEIAVPNAFEGAGLVSLHPRP